MTNGFKSQLRRTWTYENGGGRREEGRSENAPTYLARGAGRTFSNLARTLGASVGARRDDGCDATERDVDHGAKMHED